MPIVRFETYHSAVEFYNDTFMHKNPQMRPLAAYLFTENRKLINEFHLNISAGTLAINNCLTFQISDLPFGGIGESGLGKYHHEHSFECFSHKQPIICVKKSKLLGLGYCINSLVYKMSMPPFVELPRCCTFMATRKCSMCC